MRDLIMRFRGNAVIDMLAGAAAKSILLIVVFAVFHAATLDVSADYATQVLADEPLVYLRMQEENVGHFTGAINSGSAAGYYYYLIGNDPDTGAPDGSFTDVVSMDGTTSPGKKFSGRAHIGYEPWASATQSALSIEFMLRLENYIGGLQSIFSANDWQATGAVHLNLNDNLLQFWMMNIEPPRSLDIGAHVDAGDWAHIVFTYDAYAEDDVVKWYVNGAFVDSQNVADASYVDVSLPSTIAAWADDRYLNHSLDEFAIYDKVLSGADVERHYLAIPEPATGTFLVLGILGVEALRRRFRGVTV